MSYKLTKADGNSVIVQDYSKEIIGGLTMLGYGFTNYGDEMAQNFIKDLENNAGLVEPANPVLGQFWFQLPLNQGTDNKNLRVCVSTTGVGLEDRWKTIVSISPTGSVQVDAWTLRGKAPASIDGSSTTPGMPVVLNNNGKIPNQYLNITEQTVVDTSVRLRDAHTFGSRNGGLVFNGTQDVPLTTSHIAEGDQQYFTTQRARSSISGQGGIVYDPNTGVISFDSNAGGGVRTFNGRSGNVSLSSGDVTGALGFTPFSQNGGSVFGDVNALGQLYASTPNSGTAGALRIRENGSSGMSFIQFLTSDGQNQRGFMSVDQGSNLGWNGNTVWHRGNDGSGSGLDADLLDGQDGYFYRDLANAIGSIPASSVLTASQFDTTGYIVLVNQLVIQWGRYRITANREFSVTVTFPLAMSTEPFVAVATPYIPYWSNVQDLWVQKVTEGAGSYMTIGFQSDDGKDQGSGGFDWIVIGRL